jgi:hypothetical protein
VAQRGQGEPSASTSLSAARGSLPDAVQGEVFTPVLTERFQQVIQEVDNTLPFETRDGRMRVHGFTATTRRGSEADGRSRIA